MKKLLAYLCCLSLLCFSRCGGAKASSDLFIEGRSQYLLTEDAIELEANCFLPMKM